LADACLWPFISLLQFFLCKNSQKNRTNTKITIWIVQKVT
jgi:hypothetical protein